MEFGGGQVQALRDYSSIQLGRSVVHAGGGSILPVAALIAPIDVVQIASIAIAGLLVCVEFFRKTSHCFRNLFLVIFRRILRADEVTGAITGASYLAVSSAIVVNLFPLPISSLALFFVALGDPVAGVVGSTIGRVRLPIALFRNLKVKTLEGSAAFLGASLLVGILFWSQGLVTSFWIVILGAGIATLIEGLPVPINDNFTVPLGSALVMGIVWST